MSDTPAEAPAVDPPGDKIYICPACGLRYDEPTTCTNGHPPTETVEYDKATVVAADSGDEAAIAAIAQTEADAAGAGLGAGVAPSETLPPEPVAAEPAAADVTPAAVAAGIDAAAVGSVAEPEPAAAEPVAAEPVPEPAAPVAAVPDVGAIFSEIETAIENAAAAVRAAKTSLGL